MKAKKLFSLLLCAALVMVLLPAPARAAADAIYLDVAGDDARDGASAAAAVQTLEKALELVNDGGTIYVAPGTYAGPNNCVTIGKNVTIVGTGTANPVFSAGGVGRIFTVSAGFTVTLQSLILANGGNVSPGGAIYNQGTLTVADCTFNNNISTGFGGAILNEGTLTVTGSTFTVNAATASSGGAIFNAGALIVTGSAFTDNAAGSYGGAIYSSTTLTVTNCVFTGNAAHRGGAIYHMFTGLTLTGSAFTGNAASDRGGAIFLDMATATINFNRFVGNTALALSDIDENISTVNARYNWWGSNAPDLSGRVPGSALTATPWLVLRAASAPASVAMGAASTVTADLLYDSDGAYHAPADGHVPDETPVSFAVQTGPGSVTPTSATLANGAAATAFTSATVGISAVAATVDGQTTPANVTVSAATATAADSVGGIAGQTVDLIAHVVDSNADPVDEGLVRFTVNGVIAGTANVVSGTATFANWTIPSGWSAGAYTITADYLAATFDYLDSSGTGTLTVSPPAVPGPGYFLRTLQDGATGVSVYGMIREDARLTVGNLTLGTDAACNAIRQRMNGGDGVFLLGKDISLSQGFVGTLTVSLPVGAQYNGKTVTILHCAGGTLKTYTAIVADGRATFSVTSLSPFAAFLEGGTVGLPQTGGSGSPAWPGALALAVLGTCLLALGWRRRGIN